MPEAPYLFVSYANVDRERVFPLVDRLTAGGVSVWIDRDGIHGGANYAQVINDAIKGASALLLLASPASLASRNVRQEIALGWRYETPYLPLLLDPVTIPDELAYWLEGCQWIELLDRPEAEWLPELARALAPLGLALNLTPAGRSPSFASRERPLLVGRQREQGLLRERLERALGGQGSVVLVGGVAGIGKTTLVEDLSVQAEEQGALVLWGHAYDLSVTPPYGPWLEIFRRYQALGSDLPPAPAFFVDTAELATVRDQDALFAVTSEFFRSVAAARPLMLVLDDLHWADQASLDLFRYLARQAADQRLLLVATYRSDELHRRHPLYALLPLLVRESAALRVDVQPLDAVGRRAIIESRYALVEADRLRLEQYLERQAEGNPFYAEELLRTLEEEHILMQEANGWVLGRLEQARVPPLLRQVIEGRVARLDDESQRLLEVAAVIGQMVPLEIWRTVAEVDGEALLELAERAEDADLLEAEPEGDGVRFGHALIREALYEGTPSLRRRRLHRRVAEALLARVNPDPDAVAYHFDRAGDLRAVDWLQRAGERACRLYVPDAAIEHFDQAEMLAERSGQTLPETFYRARGQANSVVGQFNAARTDFETVLKLARQTGDQHAEWQALIDLGLLWASRDYTRSGGFFQQALTLARAMNDPSLTAHSLNRIGNWHANIEQLEDARREHQEALTIFEQLNDRRGIAASCDLLGQASSLDADLVHATAYYRRAIELFREDDDREGLSSALTSSLMGGVMDLSANVVIPPLDRAAGARDGEEALAIARMIGWRAGEVYTLENLGSYLSSWGRVRRALELVTRGLEIAEQIGHRQWQVLSHCVAGGIYAGLMAYPEAQQHLDLALSQAREIASGYWMHNAVGFRASLAIAQGDLSLATAILDEVLQPDMPMRSLGHRVVWSARVELALARGEAEEARDLLDRLWAAAPDASSGQPILRYSMLRADALLQLNQLDAAEVSLREALAIAKACEAPPWSWRPRLALGEIYHRRGDQERAAAERAAARVVVDMLAGELDAAELRQAFLVGVAQRFSALDRPAAP